MCNFIISFPDKFRQKNKVDRFIMQFKINNISQRIC